MAVAMSTVRIHAGLPPLPISMFPSMWTKWQVRGAERRARMNLNTLWSHRSYNLTKEETASGDQIHKPTEYISHSNHKNARIGKFHKYRH